MKNLILYKSLCQTEQTISLQTAVNRKEIKIIRMKHKKRKIV